MERVLSCAELLHLILDNAKVDKKSLARSARVCQAWFEPAIRHLWSSLDNVQILFSLLKKDSHSNGTVYMTETDADWSRFDLYAKHVRRLEFHTDDDNEVDMYRSLTRLAFTRPLKCLVPNINYLNIVCDLNILNSLFFIREKLRELEIQYSSGDSHSILYDFFHHILPRTPNLAILRINCHDDLDQALLPYKDVFISSLQGMTYLQQIETDGFNLNPDIILCLASLPNLKSFTHFGVSSLASFELEELDPAFIASAEKLQLSFPCLERVTIYCHLTSFNHFLSLKLCLPSVESLSLHVMDGSTDLALRKCFNCLASEWNTLSIFQLSLDDIGDESLHFNIFQELSGLHDLEQFWVDSSIQIETTDNAVHDVIENWPQLTSFTFHSPDLGRSSNPTFSVLTSFARHCENIKFLSFHVDATQSYEIPPDVPVMENLERIQFDTSPILDPEMVALNLSQICPVTCQVGTITGRARDETTAKYQSGWLQVSKSLKLIHEVIRRQSIMNNEASEADSESDGDPLE